MKRCNKTERSFRSRDKRFSNNSYSIFTLEKLPLTIKSPPNEIRINHPICWKCIRDDWILRKSIWLSSEIHHTRSRLWRIDHWRNYDCFRLYRARKFEFQTRLWKSNKQQKTNWDRIGIYNRSHQEGIPASIGCWSHRVWATSRKVLGTKSGLFERYQWFSDRDMHAFKIRVNNLISSKGTPDTIYFIVRKCQNLNLWFDSKIEEYQNYLLRPLIFHLLYFFRSFFDG